MTERVVSEAFVPKPAFNAEVACRSDLTEELLPSFFRGIEADGAVLTEEGQAYLLASADCLTGVFYDPDHHVAVGTHQGRDALAPI